jgi:beta-glucanase (GH16 family)
MFTYTCGSSDSACVSANSTAVQEADIEILTGGPQNKVQLTNQPSVDAAGDSIPQSTLNATLSTGTWEEWMEYRFDWTPSTSRWYVDGSVLGDISFQTPKDPSSIILNMWSDGGVWSGVMPVGGEAYLQIQWMQLLFNQSTQTQKRDQGGCIIECSIDQPDTILGQAVVMANNTATAHSMAGPDLRGDVKSKLLWEYSALVVVFGICYHIHD